MSWLGRYVRRGSCGAALAYMCYSCSNIVVVSIHIHAFKKPSCVHGSIVSPIMFPPYSNHRLGDSITSARAMVDISVCLCVCVCALRKMPCTQGSLFVMIVSSRCPLDFRCGNPESLFQGTPCQTLSTLVLAWCHQHGPSIDCEEKLRKRR